MSDRQCMHDINNWDCTACLADDHASEADQLRASLAAVTAERDDALALLASAKSFTVNWQHIQLGIDGRWQVLDRFGLRDKFDTQAEAIAFARKQ